MTKHVIFKSSSISEAMWIGETTGKFYVMYRNRKTIYCYHHVPASIADAFFAAESKGEYLNTIIKPQFYFTKGY